MNSGLWKMLITFHPKMEEAMSSLPIFDIIPADQIKKVKVVFPGGFLGIVDERFKDYISETLTSSLDELRKNHPEKAMDACPENFVTEGVLTAAIEKVYTDGEFVFTVKQYARIEEVISTKEIILPWEVYPCRSIPSELVDEEMWTSQLGAFVDKLKCAEIKDIVSVIDVDDLVVLRDYDNAIRRFRPKIRLKFGISKTVSNKVNGKSAKWECRDNNLIDISLCDYCWQIMDSKGEPEIFGGCDNFQEVLNSIKN
ncbi:MAG: hypothetical protein ACD_7C00367G0004 [uncultured bacterium]|nr:MAG: hypothetical protein ACD_7C00367G0004 [uncultured bacterium]